MDRWQLVQTKAGSEVLQFAVPQKHFHRIFHRKRFERIHWLLFQMHHTCSVQQSTKCAPEFLPIRGGCPSGSIFILQHNILHNIMLPHFILLLYILCFGELPPDLPRLPGCRSLMEPESGLLNKSKTNDPLICVRQCGLRGHCLLRSGAYESAISTINHQRLPHILTVKICL